MINVFIYFNRLYVESNFENSVLCDTEFLMLYRLRDTVNILIIIYISLVFSNSYI